ncbi:MAG: M48 family metalloprotease [Desulfobacterales bacterium]|nr:M48 family metalloprotease [Desulfobacterales bacterium]MDD3082834.1 M48 family metalloprotease [Desulfobacterales bacterium]MDD3951984.1 M48 family metalloprotease [Desulfobacterales bacterium]
MFANFIYLILALLIFDAHLPSEAPSEGFVAALFWTVVLALAFAAFTHIQFRRIGQRCEQEPIPMLDSRFSAAMTRCSIIALAVFALDIYALNLRDFSSQFSLFELFPTVEGVVFIGLFIAHLCMVWALAYPAYRYIYRSEMSLQGYVGSNISFSVPILIPWLILSGILDLIQLLPFEGLRQFLSTTEGEVVYFLIFLFIVAITGPALIQKFWKCTPLESGPARARIEALCRFAGVRYAQILRWPIFGGKMITAAVMGLIRRFRYILVTDAMLYYLSPAEIDAVISHEIGHVKQKHLVFYLVFFAGYLLISYALFDLIVFALLYLSPLSLLIDSTGVNQTTAASAIFSLTIILMFILYFRFIFGFFMRNFERQADCYVFRILDTGRPLIEALKKIAVTSGLSPDKPNWHHFSISQRIRYMEQCEADRRWVTDHDRKVRKGIVVYLTALVIAGTAGYHLNFGQTGKALNVKFFESILMREIEKTPEDAALHAALGNLYFEAKNYTGAISAYDRSLMLNPDNPETLNNLAWLLATCEDETCRNLDMALTLSHKAVALKPAAHILDTLAESYFVNGRFIEALEAGKQALAIAADNRTYYEKQIKRFSAAAKDASP